MEVLAAAWRFCLLGQVHADYAIERFSSDSPPDGSEVLALMTMPNAMRDYLRDEAQFPPQFEELRDRIVAELSAIAGAMFAVVDYPAAVKKLETRRDNLKEIQLEIEKIVPEHILMAEPSPTP
jgi:anion-transporting  ArsA/GET3 family ATPase